MIPVMAVALVLYYKFQYKTQLKTFLASMLLVVIFFSALPIINSSIGHIRNGIQGNLEDRASSILDLSESSNAGRLQIWKESLVFAIKHPFGVGFGNFITTLNAENKPLDNFTNERNKRYNLPQKYITAHNLYLQILVETSIVGLALFILMWLIFFKDIWKKITSPTAKANSYKLTAISLTLILLWCLSYSAFDLTWLNDKILLYTFVLLAIIRYQGVKPHEQTS
jgi:O-antigen ligase